MILGRNLGNLRIRLLDDISMFHGKHKTLSSTRGEEAILNIEDWPDQESPLAVCYYQSWQSLHLPRVTTTRAGITSSSGVGLLIKHPQFREVLFARTDGRGQTASMERPTRHHEEWKRVIAINLLFVFVVSTLKSSETFLPTPEPLSRELGEVEVAETTSHGRRTSGRSYED